MQGTPLDEVFSNFTHPLRPISLPVYGIREAPEIPTRDASSSTLSKLSQEIQFQGLTEELPVLSDTAKQLHLTLEEYRCLKNEQKHVMEEITTVEKIIKELEQAENASKSAMLAYMNQLLHDAILSKEDFDHIQTKKEEFLQLQAECTEKVLAVHVKRAVDLHQRCEAVNVHLLAYSDFIKAGVREMAGPDVKPNSCSICFEREVNLCFVPCGHTFCDGCVKKSSAKNCMSCRSPVEKTIKIYIGT